MHRIVSFIGGRVNEERYAVTTTYESDGGVLRTFMLSGLTEAGGEFVVRLSNGTGTPIGPPADAVFVANTLMDIVATWDAPIINQLDDLVFHDIEFDFSDILPPSTFQVESITFALPVPSGTIEIGEWQVPEPSSIVVWFLLGLTLTGACRWRRRTA